MRFVEDTLTSFYQGFQKLRQFDVDVVKSPKGESCKIRYSPPMGRRGTCHRHGPHAIDCKGKATDVSKTEINRKTGKRICLSSTPPISGAIHAVVRSASNFAARASAPADPKTETSYDSDEFPKFAADSGEVRLSPTCAGPVKTAWKQSSFHRVQKVGALLSTELTDDGVRYAQEAIAAGGEVAELWAGEFAHYL